MASLGELFVTVGARIEGFQQAMTSVSAELDKVDAKANKATSGFDKLAEKMTGLGVGLTAAVTAPLAGLGLAVANVAGSFEQTTAAFTNFLGSSERAAAFLQQLKDFAAKTPFEFTGLIDAAKRMMAFGFAAEQVLPMLRIIGDAVAGIGGGAAEIDRVTLALGQMQAKGKVSAQEMNQLAELGIPAWKMLSDQIGVSIPEAMKLAEKGAISASVAIPAILDGMNQKFGGLMDQQSKTLLGMWSNFKDQVTFTLIDLGKVLLPVFKNMLSAALPLVEAVKNMAAAFAAMPQPLQTAALAFTAIVAALGPLLIIAGQAITVFTTLSAAMPMLAAGGAALVGAFANITTALQLGMVGALTAAETALLAVSAAVGGVVVAFAAWQLGSWLYEHSEAVRKFGDTVADVALVNIPYLENAIMRLSGVTATQARANDDLDFATAKLEKTLKAHGVTVERGTMSADQYAKALREKAKQLGADTKASADNTKATRGNADATDQAAKAAKALKEAYDKLGLRDRAKDTQELQHAIDALKRSGDWNELSTKQQQQAMDKLADATFKVTGFTYNWQQALVGLSTQQVQVKRNTDAMFESMEQVGAGISGVSQQIQDMPMGMINEELMTQAEAAMRAAGEIHELENAYLKADLKNKNAIYEMFKAQIEAAKEAGETIPAEQQKLLDRMEKELKTDKITGKWSEFSNEVSTIITNFAQNISKALWDGDMSWGEKGKQLLKELGQAVTSLFVTPAIDAVAKFVTDAIEGLLKGAIDNAMGWLGNLGGKIAGVFGGGAADAATGGGIPTGGGGAPSGGGGGGSMGGGGWMGAVDMASGVVGAVSAVVGNFQMAHMNTALGRIEESTRWTKEDIHNLLPKLTNDFAAVLPSVNDRLIEFRSIGIAVWPKEGYEDAFNGGGGVNVTIQGNVIGTDDAAQTFADIIAGKLAAQGAS